MKGLRSRFLDAGGWRVHLLDGGRGPGVLLVASPLVLARTYAPLLRLLVATRRVVALELPGSGRSSCLPRPLSFAELAEAAAAVLDALGGAWTVIGHSASGPVAVELAARRPRQVERLVLVDSIGTRRASTLRVIVDRARDALGEPALTLRASAHALCNLARHPRALLAHVRASARPGGLERGKRVGSRTLVAWGRRDATLPPPCAERVREALPGARLAPGPGRHDWLLTHPRAFLRVLRAAGG